MGLEVVIAPPALYLLLTRDHARQGIEVAAQNVFDRPNGAFTGEISAEQLKDSGITWALAGHSERRVIIGEDDSVSRTIWDVGACPDMGIGGEYFWALIKNGKRVGGFTRERHADRFCCG